MRESDRLNVDGGDMRLPSVMKAKKEWAAMGSFSPVFGSWKESNANGFLFFGNTHSFRANTPVRECDVGAPWPFALAAWNLSLFVRIGERYTAAVRPPSSEIRLWLPPGHGSSVPGGNHTLEVCYEHTNLHADRLIVC